MPHDPRVTAYIAKSPTFAQPILEHIRGVMHRARPDLDEAIKWSIPFFVLNGQPIANMAAFKAHAAFGFWRREAVGGGSSEAMGQFGKLATVADLPDEPAIAAMIANAVALAAAGGKTPRTLPGNKPALAVPDDLQVALDAMPAAATGFGALPPGALREYLEWVAGAKQEATRARRIATTVAQTAEGKKLNAKYELC